MRGHGEGTIFQRKDGRWQAQITLEGGQRKRKTFYGKTKKEVQEKLRVAINQQKLGILATGPQQTLEVYLLNWLENVYKPHVRPLSYVQHRSAINLHLIPGLGKITLQKLTPERIQAFYAQKLQEGLAPRSIALIHAALHGALENAVKWNLVSRNVAKLVSLPRTERHEIQPLTPEQARKLIEVSRGTRLEAMLVVALTTGMRRGELLALRWEDVDIEHGVLQVRRTVNHVSGHGYVENGPKTKAGRRKIMLPNFTIVALKEHRLRQNKQRDDAGDKWQERGLVFTNASGSFMRPYSVLEWFSRILKDADLPHMRFHDLRHSAATILLSKGVQPKVVQELLGHSNISMTMDVYGHVMPSMQQDAIQKLDDLYRDM